MVTQISLRNCLAYSATDHIRDAKQSLPNGCRRLHWMLIVSISESFCPSHIPKHRAPQICQYPDTTTSGSRPPTAYLSHRSITLDSQFPFRPLKLNLSSQPVLSLQVFHEILYTLKNSGRSPTEQPWAQRVPSCSWRVPGEQLARLVPTCGKRVWADSG